MLSTREIFDKVKTHLLTQRRKSWTKSQLGGITYNYWNKEKNLKCAIGILIPEDMYDASFEGVSVGPVFSEHESSQTGHAKKLRKALGAGGVPTIFDDSIEKKDVRNVLERLQDIHDAEFVKDWAKSLDEFEVEFFGKGVE